jgi:hypothetical protein
MNPNMALTRPSAAAGIAVGLAIAFMATLALLHFLEPEIDPSRRLISEYETGSFGGLMTLAFFCWGGSALASLVALWPYLRNIPGKVGGGWLLLISVALFGAGIFQTNAVTDPTPSTANTLHALCGAFVIFTFPIAASLVAAGLARNPVWAAARRRLAWGTVLVWLAFLAFFGVSVAANAGGPSAAAAPDVPLGWPNRLMVVIYDGWLILVASRALRISRAK